MFVESSHVKFLEAAGARVIPIDMEMKDEKLEELLKQINGVYIPGDQKVYAIDSQHHYTKMVQSILQKA